MLGWTAILSLAAVPALAASAPQVFKADIVDLEPCPPGRSCDIKVTGSTGWKLSAPGMLIGGRGSTLAEYMGKQICASDGAMGPGLARGPIPSGCRYMICIRALRQDALEWGGRPFDSIQDFADRDLLRRGYKMVSGVVEGEHQGLPSYLFAKKAPARGGALASKSYWFAVEGRLRLVLVNYEVMHRSDPDRCADAYMRLFQRIGRSLVPPPEERKEPEGDEP